MRPVGSHSGHDVSVRHQQQRFHARGSRDSRDQRHHSGLALEGLGGDSLFVENRFEIRHRGCSVARWIGGVEAQVSAEVIEGLGIDLVPINLRRGLSESWTRECEQRDRNPSQYRFKSKRYFSLCHSERSEESRCNVRRAQYVRIGSALAFWAKETRTLSHHHILNWRRACVAWFSLAAVYAQTRGETSGLSTRIAVTAKGSAVVANRCAQNDRHGRRDFFDLASRHTPSAPRRTHARLKQNLGRVDIADTSDDSLIHQQVF